MNDDGTYQLRRGGGRKALVITMLFTTGAAAALGFGAYRLYTELELSRTEVHRLEGERKTLSDALELHRATSVDLDGKLARCTSDLTNEKTSSAETEQKRVALDVELGSCQKHVADLKQTTAEAQETLGELKGLAGSFKKMIDAGKLDVTFRRGNMVVNLPAAVLFPSGSAEISPEGVQALAEVARVLRTMRGRRFTVAGHTDDVPLAQAQFKDNWELSSARAVGVTRLLIEKGMAGSHLVAAGFGPFDPIAGNGSPAGRQKNRRIEIILEPNLKRLAALETAQAGKGK